MTGDEMLKKLANMSEEERRYTVFGEVWSPGSVDFVLEWADANFTDAERATVKAMPVDEKFRIVSEARQAYMDKNDPNTGEYLFMMNHMFESVKKWLAEHKTKYSVTLSFLCHVTLSDIMAKNPDEATEIALGMLKDGKVTTDSFKDDDTWPDSVEVDEVYDEETYEVKKSVYMDDNYPKQKKDFEKEERP